jgi:predicted ABC-type ATPase
MVAEINRHARSGRSFPFETTLAHRGINNSFGGT